MKHTTQNALETLAREAISSCYAAAERNGSREPSLSVSIIIELIGTRRLEEIGYSVTGRLGRKRLYSAIWRAMEKSEAITYSIGIADGGLNQNADVAGGGGAGARDAVNSEAAYERIVDFKSCFQLGQSGTHP